MFPQNFYTKKFEKITKFYAVMPIVFFNSIGRKHTAHNLHLSLQGTIVINSKETKRKLTLEAYRT